MSRYGQYRYNLLFVASIYESYLYLPVSNNINIIIINNSIHINNIDINTILNFLFLFFFIIYKFIFFFIGILYI